MERVCNKVDDPNKDNIYPIQYSIMRFAMNVKQYKSTVVISENPVVSRRRIRFVSFFLRRSFQRESVETFLAQLRFEITFAQQMEELVTASIQRDESDTY